MENMKGCAAAALATYILGLVVSAQAPAPSEPSPWTTRTKPFHVAANIYYVGTLDLASYLITTPEGHILLETGVEQNADAVADGVRALGFRVEDIRFILTTQAHVDHVGAHARVKQLSGARVLVSERDRPLVESGGRGDFHFGSSWTFPPTRVDATIADGEEVRLGGVVLTAHLTPGHTKGCTTWTMRVRDDGGAVKDVVFVGSTSVNEGVKLLANPAYPEIADDYARTFKILKALECDLFLAAHASAAGGLDKLGKAGDAEYRKYLAASEQAFERELRRQRDAGSR